MAANLTPQYYKAEETYRRSQTTPEKLIALQEMLRLIPKHKGTDHLQGALRSRLSELRATFLLEKKNASRNRSWRIPRQGCGTVVVIGAPNSGKSRLVGELSNAQPVIADYPYSTREPIAGMLDYSGVPIQLIDTPPISASQIEPYVVDFVRTADLVLCCFDGSSDEAGTESMEVLHQLGIRKTVLSDQTGFDPADFSIGYVKSRLVMTRAKSVDSALRLKLLNDAYSLCFPVLSVDFAEPADVRHLSKSIFEALDLIRIFTKRPGHVIEYIDPFLLPIGGTVEDLAMKVHAEIAGSLKFAKVWRNGTGVSVSVGRTFVLLDQDVVELHH